MPYITAFNPSLSAPTFTFRMNKDEYAAMFAGSNQLNYIHVRIVSWDEKSASSLNTVTDTFQIEVSLGCMDDRIVPPP